MKFEDIYKIKRKKKPITETSSCGCNCGCGTESKNDEELVGQFCPIPQEGPPCCGGDKNER
ncbi:MAG: hypothetical protein AMQ74_01454 [Candidatus Methanofastidiosum methylothiophilum]|uniref:Uncharacterized protein n=1 Tax=Candidatus Methanofastidiosum methylothiophilum TaxID=1705564 RepID=A0A150IWJ0_9EURY|nr:MAG: hypothetical protein AMQ74_01454 [Candidatus Methanofastidiosum methylthiophilus]NMC77625.1 hypothetical protein [Candidatus Methanofastidiosa archaeon]